MMKTIILDNGHGENTPGKRSPVWPDGTRLFEYEFNRDIVQRISVALGKHGIDCRILVPEHIDISLQERCRRANAIYKACNRNAFLVSVHANAGGGTGWECYTSVGKTESDKIADVFYDEAKKMFPEWKIRSDFSDGDADKEENFYILKNTVSPAVLTENFFMDTEKDCRFIMSGEGRQKVAEMHVKAIRRVITIE
jgi:N-acetylmuramoyl-L-alanine amidase